MTDNMAEAVFGVEYLSPCCNAILSFESFDISGYLESVSRDYF